jgi:hypothetical protein
LGTVCDNIEVSLPARQGYTRTCEVSEAGETVMDETRLFIRFVKLCLLFGTVGLLAEGLFELKLVLRPFTDPPSIPGQSKIIEHFALQHVLLPILGLVLVFWPIAAKDAFGSIWFRVFIGCLVVLVTVPEIIVSWRFDLFRPYPFDLNSGFLEALQIVKINGRNFNLLQAQHLIFSHLFLMGTMLWLCLAPDALKAFAGPHTGMRQFTEYSVANPSKTH